MGRRILNDALRTIVNAEKRNKATADLQPVSTVICSFLHIMKRRGYVKDFQVHDLHRVGRVTVELLGRINDCKALTYRQDLKARDIEQYRLRMLPTRQWGYVVITTPNGVLDHEEAIRQNNFKGSVDAFRVKTIDTTGAGDAFVGALLNRIVDDHSIIEDEVRLREVLKFANACGAITTTKKGAIPALPTEAEALELIKSCS